MLNVTWSQLSQWFFSLSLQDCGWLLRCLVSGHGVWQKSVIFRNTGRCPQLAVVYFLSLQSTKDRPLLFHPRVSLGMLCFLLAQAACRQRETLSSAALLPVPLNTVYDESLLIMYYSQHPLVIVKAILHNNPPLPCLPHTSHEGFQRQVQVNLFIFLYILDLLFFIIIQYLL